MRYHQLTITAPGRLTAGLIQTVMRHGALGVTELPDGFTAYFPGTTDISLLMTELSILGAVLERSSADGRIRVKHAAIRDRDWNEEWKKSFKPVRIGRRFVILPPWEKAPRERIPLIIDPGMAFGTGHHETTRSCLILMEKYAGSVPEGKFLDLGTGTGLLAIAARKLGFRKAIGVDTDPLSIAAARKNRTLNKADGIVLRKGSLDDVKGTFDMIAANLLAGTLIELTRAIADRTAAYGIVIMSGILKGQDTGVAGAAKRAGLKLRERYRDGKWVSLALVK